MYSFYIVPGKLFTILMLHAFNTCSTRSHIQRSQSAIRLIENCIKLHMHRWVSRWFRFYDSSYAQYVVLMNSMWNSGALTFYNCRFLYKQQWRVFFSKTIIPIVDSASKSTLKLEFEPKWKTRILKSPVFYGPQRFIFYPLHRNPLVHPILNQLNPFHTFYFIFNTFQYYPLFVSTGFQTVTVFSFPISLKNVTYAAHLIVFSDC